MTNWWFPWWCLKNPVPTSKVTLSWFPWWCGRQSMKNSMGIGTWRSILLRKVAHHLSMTWQHASSSTTVVSEAQFSMDVTFYRPTTLRVFCRYSCYSISPRLVESRIFMECMLSHSNWPIWLPTHITRSLKSFFPHWLASKIVESLFPNEVEQSSRVVATGDEDEEGWTTPKK